MGKRTLETDHEETPAKGRRFTATSSMGGHRHASSPEAQGVTTIAMASSSSSRPTSSDGSIRSSKALRARRHLYHSSQMVLNSQLVEWARDTLAGRNGPIPNDAFYYNIADNYTFHSKEILRRFNRSYGDVAVFGDGDCGQLGCGEGISSARVPRILVGMRNKNVNMLACGGLHTLALSEEGVVYSWGCNDEGSLGVDAVEDGFMPGRVGGFYASEFGPNGRKKGVVAAAAGDDSAALVPFEQRKEANIVQIAAGETQSLALSTDGDVYMWGAFKDSEGRSFRNMPPQDDSRCPTGRKDMSTLEEDERPEWFQPPRGNQDWPLHVFQIERPAKDISAGGSFNAALLDDDTIVTWGIGTTGEMARGEGMSNLDKKTSMEIIKEKFLKPAPPVWAVPMKRTVLSLSCGGFHLLVVARDADASQNVYSCGLNQYAQLGLGDIENRNVLTKVTFFEERDITTVEGGYQFSCFVDATGKKLYACGRGDYGNLGITLKQPGAGWFEKTPTRVPLVHTIDESTISEEKKKETCIVEADIDEEKQPEIAQISCGSTHVIVRTKGGDVYTWGFGEQGACGQGKDYNDVLRPKKLETKLKNIQGSQYEVKFVSGGGQHSSVVIATGSKGFH
ncbi:predicted protein [Thalassiosira pseudonana CCMP1335]|uniref:RCC1-like domain-containing protein n=1 Tax=Thalassiosira pseudonana TaxID=35128 RepID=B8C4Q0_THAPS|nr:predicted protein [Thalassiosira pseudonana CCMP1335]EED91362.1 predicted protein [Thalassiosira pseudonana CCMP1335]